MTPEEFLKWEEASRDTIDVKRCYVDIAGDLVTGVLLSQIIFYHLPDRTGERSKLRVRRGGAEWLVKEREDWWEECRISPKQFDRAAQVLETKHIIRIEKHLFNAKRAIHIALNFSELIKEIKRVTAPGYVSERPRRNKNDEAEGESEVTEKANPESPERRVQRSAPKGDSITENAEITTEDSLVRGSKADPAESEVLEKIPPLYSDTNIACIEVISEISDSTEVVDGQVVDDLRPKTPCSVPKVPCRRKKEGSPNFNDHPVYVALREECSIWLGKSSKKRIANAVAVAKALIDDNASVEQIRAAAAECRKDKFRTQHWIEPHFLQDKYASIMQGGENQYGHATGKYAGYAEWLNKQPRG
jgi:hypothetical protein